jgi:hypothetical protein
MRAMMVVEPGTVLSSSRGITTSGGGAVSRLGFVYCRGGDVDDLLRGIEDIWWAAAGPAVGGRTARAPPRPWVDGGRGTGLVGRHEDRAEDPSHGDMQGGGRRGDRQRTLKKEEGVS